MSEINLHFAADAETLEKLGAGSVLGLSEARVALPFECKATSLSSLQFKINPFHRLDSIIKGLLPELRANLVTIIKRHLAAEPFKGWTVSKFQVEKCLGGQSFGEAAILKGGIRGASIRAKGDVVFKKISNDDAAELLTSYSPLLVVIMEALLLQQVMNNAIKYA